MILLKLIREFTYLLVLCFLVQLIDLNSLVSGFAIIKNPLTEENMSQYAKVDNNDSEKITQSTLEEVASARVPKALGSDDENLQEEEATSSSTG